MLSVTPPAVSWDTPLSYKFTYNYASDLHLLTDSTTNEVDYWGYYSFNGNPSLKPKVHINTSNPLLPRYSIYNVATAGGSYNMTTTGGYDRVAAYSNFDIGCLHSITNYQGGSTTITYEPNTYIDAPSGAEVRGGGIRVSQIADYDGINPSNNIVRYYSYIDPGTLKTSGKPISLPQFAFTAPYNGSATGQAYWDYVTVISDDDLSSEDHSIVYSYFKTTLSSGGAGGSILYHSSNPATYWDLSAVPVSGGSAEWFPTKNYTARTSCSSGYGAVQSGIYSYPFIPNPNYNFERGLPLEVTTFDQDGFKVSETDYTYQRTNPPSVITAFKSDDNFTVAQSYNKYLIYYNTGELTAQVTKKSYDLSNPVNYQSNVTSYWYTSPNHRSLTRQSITKSDNSIFNTYYTYVKDYTAFGSDPNINAIYNLQQLNVNAPVESYEQVTRGTVTKTVGASLTLYGPFSTTSGTFYLPSRQLKLVQPNGTLSFNPFNTTGGTPNFDSKYFTAANFTAYDVTGYPQTTDDGKQTSNTTIVNHFSHQPIASFANAKYSEIGFSDFDSDLASPDYAFSITGSGTGVYAGAGHAGNALNLIPSYIVSKTVTKNSSSQNYTLSIWINAAVGLNGALSININGNPTGKTIPYTGTGNWKYYEQSLPVAAFSSSFNVSFTSNQSISVDDILLYPDVAEVATASYDPVTFSKTSSTNTNGVSAYFTSDEWGRLLYAYDQDHNIVQKNTYASSSQVADFNNWFFITEGVYAQSPTTFYNYFRVGAQNMSGTTMTWDYGDGSPVTTTGWIDSTLHTYPHSGTFIAHVSLKSPIYGNRIYTLTITMRDPPPIKIPVTYTNTTAGQADITSISFIPVNGVGPSYFYLGSQLIEAASNPYYQRDSVFITPNYYTMKITLSGARHYNGNNGYNSVRVTSNSSYECINWVSTNIYTENIDVSSAYGFLNFLVSPDECPTHIFIPPGDGE